MDYSETIPQDDLMFCYHDQDALRATMSAHTSDVPHDPYTDGITESSAALLTAQPCTSDHRAWPPNGWDALLEDSQFSSSSAYSLTDPPSDAISFNDQSPSTSSDEESPTPNLKPSTGNTGIFQPKCVSRTSEDEYTQPFDPGDPFLYDYSSNSSADSLPLQKARNCIDPRFLYTQRSVNCKIDGSEPQNTRSRKRRRQLEKSQITQPYDCSTIVDSGTVTRVLLLNFQTLSEARSDRSPSSLRNLMGVYAEVSSPSDDQNMETMDEMAALVDASVRELLKRSTSCTPNLWFPPSPAACLTNLGGKAVTAKPRDPKKPFACVCGCGYTSARMIDWKRHLTSNWLASYWQCPLCPKHFPPDRADKLYGKEGHLATAHSMVRAGTNRVRDYHHNVIDDMFKKHCGFCGQMCNSFGEFAKHVGAHFRDNGASPPYDMRIWKDSWDEDESNSSAHHDDDDDDENGNDNGHDQGDDNGGNRGEDDDSDHRPENDRSGSQGGSSGGGGMDGSAGHDYDHGNDSQQDPNHPDQASKYPPDRSGAMDTADMCPPLDFLGPAGSGHELHSRLFKTNSTKRNEILRASKGSLSHAARRDILNQGLDDVKEMVDARRHTLCGTIDQRSQHGRLHGQIRRRTVVVKASHGGCWAIPVNTYSGNGIRTSAQAFATSQEAHVVQYQSTATLEATNNVDSEKSGAEDPFNRPYKNRLKGREHTSRTKIHSLNVARYLAQHWPQIPKRGNESNMMAKSFLSNDHTTGLNKPISHALPIQDFAEEQSLKNPPHILRAEQHGKGRIIGYHFDLKPANILITADGIFKITDFGQAFITLVSRHDRNDSQEEQIQRANGFLKKQLMNYIARARAKRPKINKVGTSVKPRRHTSFLSDVAQAAKPVGTEPASLPQSFNVALKDSWEVLHHRSVPLEDWLGVCLAWYSILHHGLTLRQENFCPQPKNSCLTDRLDKILSLDTLPSWCPEFRTPRLACFNDSDRRYLDAPTLEKFTNCNSNQFDHDNARQRGRYFRQVRAIRQISVYRTRYTGADGSHPPIEHDEHGINALVARTSSLQIKAPDNIPEAILPGKPRLDSFFAQLLDLVLALRNIHSGSNDKEVSHGFVFPDIKAVDIITCGDPDICLTSDDRIASSIDNPEIANLGFFTHTFHPDGSELTSPVELCASAASQSTSLEMASKATASSKRNSSLKPRLPEVDWERVKIPFKQLFITEDRTIEDCASILNEEYGIDVTVTQCVNRAQRWGFFKYRTKSNSPSCIQETVARDELRDHVTLAGKKRANLAATTLPR